MAWIPQEELPSRYGGRFFTEGVPEQKFPEHGMPFQDAYQLLVEELELDGARAATWPQHGRFLGRKPSLGRKRVAQALLQTAG